MGPSVKFISAIKDHLGCILNKKNRVNFFPGEKIIPGAGGEGGSEGEMVKDHTFSGTLPLLLQFLKFGKTLKFGQNYDNSENGQNLYLGQIWNIEII